MRRLEKLTPEESEKEVRRVLSLTGRRLESFKSDHLESAKKRGIKRNQHLMEANCER